GGLLHPVLSRVTATGLALALARQRARVAAAFRGHWWRAVIAAAGNRMLDYAALVAALVAVDAKVRPAEVLLAYVVAMALAMVPVTPGGLGFVETGLTGALVLAGVGANGAVVATLLYRLMSFWLPIPVGALAWGAWTVHRRRSPGDAPGQPVLGA
ncbi:MAG: flippase-like domain-containing protein, partial [Nocardioidaceae bacterium]|nr:flippase-like domain-containing protein [Nocardioidaceae bacterium]